MTRVAFCVAVFCALVMAATANGPQATIIDTGSTNRAGMTLTFDKEGHGTVTPRGGKAQTVQLNAQDCAQFIKELEAAGPLNALPTHHCAKSISFGSSLYVEFNGERSADISCPGQEQQVSALQKSAQNMLQAAEQAAGLHLNRRITFPVQDLPRR